MKLKSFDEYLRTRFTKEEIMEIKEQAQQELDYGSMIFPSVKSDITHLFEGMYAFADAIVHDKPFTLTLTGDATIAKHWLDVLTKGLLRKYWIQGVQIAAFYELDPLSMRNLYIVDNKLAVMLDSALPHDKLHAILFSMHEAASNGIDMHEVTIEGSKLHTPVVTVDPEHPWYTCVYKWYEAYNARLKQILQDVEGSACK